MRWRIIFLVSLFSMSLLGFALNDTSVESQTTETRRTRPTELPNKAPEIESVSFNKEKVQIPCPYPDIKWVDRENCPDDDMKVEVTTVAKDEEDDVLTYTYEVPGGRIVGTGAKVIWDLSNVQPGTYWITVSADDGCGVCGKTVTKTIIVERCDCPKIDTAEVFLPCPSFDIETPKESVKAGETIVFSLNLNANTNGSPVKYHWTLSSETDIEGQGTPKIKVKTTNAMAGSLLTATVSFYYEGLRESCLRADSESVLLTKE